MGVWKCQLTARSGGRRVNSPIGVVADSFCSLNFGCTYYPCSQHHALQFLPFLINLRLRNTRKKNGEVNFRIMYCLFEYSYVKRRAKKLIRSRVTAISISKLPNHFIMEELLWKKNCKTQPICAILQQCCSTFYPTRWNSTRYYFLMNFMFSDGVGYSIEL